MRVYYGYYKNYTKKTTSELKWNTVYTCGNDLFGDPSKGQGKYCTKDTHKLVTNYAMDDGIGIGEGTTFQLICMKTTGKKCIYDGTGTVQKICLDKDYSW